MKENQHTSQLEILTYPNHFLSQPTQPLDDIDETVQEMIEKMSATMYDAPGVGLAAIQVGWDKRVLIYDVSPRDQNRSLHVLINHKIITKEGEIVSENEGCLSVPDFRADVNRAASITVKGLDREGKSIKIDAEGILAIVLQHEIDHLNGTLFIEHISSLKRQMYKRRIKKKLRMK
ncbi:MAG: peptide deformylase [Deltaproteobacteria bacterium]|nr:peptide deformylase [Deltaproteobacteria bacterium]